MSMNVWKWSYEKKRYYLLKPWLWFRELGWNIKAAYHRITKGYCDSDWMNFCDWFVDIAPNMLRELAMRGHAYPGTPPFDTPEQWNSWLHRMADQLASCQDEDAGNEYHEPYMALLEEEMKTDVWLSNKEETEAMKQARENYQRRWLEIQEEHKKVFKSTMKELIEHWDCLWD